MRYCWTFEMAYSQNGKRSRRKEQKRRHNGTTTWMKCRYLLVFLKKVSNRIKEMSYIRRRSCLQCGIILCSCWLHWKLIKQNQRVFICMISPTRVAYTQHRLSSEELVLLLPQWPLCPIHPGCTLLKLSIFHRLFQSPQTLTLLLSTYVLLIT